MWPKGNYDGLARASSAGAFFGDGGGGEAAPAAPPRLPPSPRRISRASRPTSPSRDPGAFPTSPPPLQPPRPPPLAVDRDTDNEPDDDYMPEEEDYGGSNWEHEEAEYNYGHLEEGELEDDVDSLDGQDPNSFVLQNSCHTILNLLVGQCRSYLGPPKDHRVLNGGFRHAYDYPRALGFQEKLQQMQDRQAEVIRLLECVEVSIKRLYQLEWEEAYFLNPEDFLSLVYELYCLVNSVANGPTLFILHERSLEETSSGRMLSFLRLLLEVEILTQDIYKPFITEDMNSLQEDFKSYTLTIIPRQAGFVHSRMDEAEADITRAIVFFQSFKTGYFQFMYVMNQCLVPVDLNLVTDQHSYQHLVVTALEQTVDGTCAIVAPVKCVELQHRRQYEARHGAGTFSCIAAAPRKLRKACHADGAWTPEKGAIVQDILKVIKRLGGVRTTNAPTPAPFFLPIRSWKIYRWNTGIGLSADVITWLLDTKGPFVGTIWVSPWYHLFNAAEDSDKVYRSGCARDPSAQLMSMLMFGDLVGKHSVVCTEYRRCGADLHVLILDNHGPTGPIRWIHFYELEDVQTITVKRLRRFHS